MFNTFRQTLQHSGGGRILGTQLMGQTTLSLASSSSPSPVHKVAGTAVAAATRSTQDTCTRSLHTTSRLNNAQVDNFDPQSRSAINMERYEHSQSGSDHAVAAQQWAWDPAHLTPEMAREASRQEALRDGRGLMSPLEVSPANQEVSMTTDESGRGVWVEKSPSRRVSPPKGRKLDYGWGTCGTFPD